MDEYELTEEECTLYYLSDMLDTIISQMMWMKVMIDEELDRIVERIVSDEDERQHPISIG